MHLWDSLKIENGRYKYRSHKNNRIRKIIRLGKKPIIKIVFNTSNETLAFDKEIELIKKYGRRDKKTGLLTNNTDGGDGVSGHIAGKKERLKKSISHMGSKNYMFGKNHSQATIKKMKIKRLARTKVYHHTKRWKNKLKKSTLILNSIKNSIPIYQINFDGKIIKKWSSANAAAKKFKIENSRIYICTKQNYRICLGFYWIYVKDAKILKGKLKNIKELNEKTLTHGSYSKSKSIDQFDLTGKFIKTWTSYMSVQRELGLSYNILSNIIRKKRSNNIYWGYIWKKPMKK